MRIINPSVEIVDVIDGTEILKKIERAGRTCYRSENNIGPESAKIFVRKVISLSHESVIEHEKISVRIICDRGVSHEIVRHRLGSYSQESTRYCNYSHEKFGKELTYILPSFWKAYPELMKQWEKSMRDAEITYFALIDAGAKPDEARSVLPNSLKTEIVVTYNLREWRHFLKLRTSKAAHPQIREIAIDILNKFKALVPVVFDDIQPYLAPIS